ncbi:MAG: glycosyltransferase family 1 protein [Acidobacteria bacterium]|nr:glycosyltransferase family 1 protein [Acidobacteriota bacterium]
MSAIITKVRKSGVELYLNLFAHRPEIENRDWHVAPDELKNVSIRWPDQYQWDAASDWVEVLLYGFRKHIPVEMVGDIPQRYRGTVNFELIINGRTRRIAIGYSDYMAIDEDCAETSDLYFKMQFAKRGYGIDSVVPGGYVPDGKRLYHHLGNLRELRQRREFRYDVYGRFGLAYAREIREKACGILNRQDRFAFEGGMKMVYYLEFLQEVARSKVCIDMPGLGDFCFRLINYLAIGSCVIAYPHRTMLNAPLVDRKHIVYCKEDFSDLVDLCEYYLNHDDEREQIAANAREFFDLYLHKDSLVKYYLRTCLDRLK